MDKESKKIFNAICHFTLFNLKEINDDFFKKLINFVDLSNINDREFFANERLKKFVDYNRINKKQLIRLAIRDPQILNNININKFKFKIKELEYFLNLWPEYTELFKFDIKNVTADELLILLNININYVDQIDFAKIKFSKFHLTKLIKKYNHRDQIIKKILSSNELLDNYQIRNLILQTGDKYLHNLDIGKLNELDWLNILSYKPELFVHCDLQIFEKNDCYLLTKLAKYIPDVELLIIKNKEKITNLGWENLLRLDFEKYYPLCCFDCLSTVTRNKFIHKLEPR